MCSKLGDFVTGNDVFGSAVSLNFKGSDTYKTLVGGFISMIVYGVFFW